MPEMKTIVQEQMQLDNEATAVQLQSLLTSRDEEEVHIANSYESPTKPNDCSGHKTTHKTVLKMSFGVKNVWFNSKLTKGSVAGNKEKHPDQSQGKHLACYSTTCFNYIYTNIHYLILLFRAKHPVKVHV